MFNVAFILLDFVLLLSYSRHIAKPNNKINDALTSVDEDANILRPNILSIGKHSEWHTASNFSVRQSKKIKCLPTHKEALCYSETSITIYQPT